MAQDDKNTPGWKDPRLEKFASKWERVDAVLGGTDAMRAEADDYLPQYPAEDDDNYHDRVTIATLFPAYEDTLKGYCGMVFRKPLKLGETVPARIADFWADLDLKGTHGDVFAQRLFFAGLHRGASYVLVDMQARPAELEGVVLDQAQADKLNLRPYCIRYDATHLAQLPRYIVLGGKVTLQQIVFKECAEVEDGAFGLATVERARVWRLPVVQDARGAWQRDLSVNNGKVIWETWEEQETDEAEPNGEKKKEWVPIASGVTGLNEIPVAVFNASPDSDDDTRFRGPVLDELAHAVIEYWQLKSEQRKVLRRCQPIPYTVALVQEAREAVEMAWGVDTLLHCDEGGSVAFAEPQGTGLEYRAKTMAEVKQEIHDLGLSLVVEKTPTSNTSATKERLDMQTRASRLSELARALKDCLDNVLYHMAAWVKQPAGGEVTLGVKDVDLILTSADIAALSTAVKDGNLSRRSMWATLARGGWLADDFKAEQEEAQIQQERAAFVAAQSQPIAGAVGAGGAIQ